MPEERDIEKQLRAAAEQRRKDAGGKFELHPATRRLLQGEVARVRGQKSAAPSRSFWLRFAWGVSMLAILSVGVWVLVSPHPNKKPATPVAGENAGYVQSMAASGEKRADSSAAKAAAEPMPAPVMPAAVPPPAPAEAVAVAGAVATDALMAQEQPARRQFNNLNFARQTFANAPAKKEGTKLSAAEANVLNSFALEQSGNEIRIVDNDGSVYDGKLLADSRGEEKAREKDFRATATMKSREAETDKEFKASKDDNASAQQNFRFAAAGTNLSLRQHVTITGEFVAVTNALADNISGKLQKMPDQQLKAKVQSGVWLSNGRVIGRAVTADGQAVELDAEQVQMK